MQPKAAAPAAAPATTQNERSPDGRLAANIFDRAAYERAIGVDLGSGGVLDAMPYEVWRARQIAQYGGGRLLNEKGVLSEFGFVGADELGIPTADGWQEKPWPGVVSSDNVKDVVLPADNKSTSVLTKRELALVEKFYPKYKLAADENNVPWQMIAALHYREADFSTTSSRPGGVFQNDPPGRYAGEDDFGTAVGIAASRLQEKSGGRLAQNISDDEIIKDAFWGYNGRAKWHITYDGSSYVMNKFNDNYMGPNGDGMILKGTLRRPDGSNMRIERADKKYGAWVIYNDLKARYK